MRLWSLHPQYLDAKGLVACWREGLLAKKVLAGETKGYKNHPQLYRFKTQGEPATLINQYLLGIFLEAARRGYSFDPQKIQQQELKPLMQVNSGQMAYELGHLKSKLLIRDEKRYQEILTLQQPIPHPLFQVVAGEVEEWEKT